MSKHLRHIVCNLCGAEAPIRGQRQKYCVPCSEIKSAQRNSEWARTGGYRRLRERLSVRGAKISKEHRSKITTIDYEPNLIWQTKISIPFSWASSKNHIWSTAGGGGHVVKRKAKKEFQEQVVKRLEGAGVKQNVKQNKLWVSIFVQKPNHRGDAINALDTICDAIKVATGLDDRWFSIKNLDWQIVKEKPLIFITIGQENVENVRACSSCGQILTFDKFQSNRGVKHGISRTCKLCCQDDDRARRPPGTQSKKKSAFEKLFW